MGSNQGLRKVQDRKRTLQTEKYKERNKFDAEYGEWRSSQIVLKCRNIDKDKFGRGVRRRTVAFVVC